MITLRQELKAMILDNLMTWLFTVIVFTGLLIFWFQIVVPEHRAEFRSRVQNEIRAKCFLVPAEWRDEMMEKFEFTFDDINPSKLLREFEGDDDGYSR